MAQLINAYPVEKGTHSTIFEFVSDGPKGSIRKRIEFIPFDMNLHIYNLALGDVNELNEIDDLIITNNNDTQKVLETVARCVQLLLEEKPNTGVFATGNTTSRTRLYRMAITKHFKMLTTNFQIQGYNNGWENFRIGIEYQAFLVTNKNS